jgi:NADH dehydrogenase
VSRDRSYLNKGALNFVVVGAGPTGAETAGAPAELVRNIIPQFYRDVPVELALVHLVDLGHVVLNGFSNRAHAYASGRLGQGGVQIHLGVAVAEIGPGHVRATLRRSPGP